MDAPRIALITGPPGVGKTTLIKKLGKLCDPVMGFYTEEVRGSNGVRLGFDVVSLDNESIRKPLAREASNQRGPKVGKYTVHLSDFESIALPCLEKSRIIGDATIIIDEIGKMELFSSKFQGHTKALFESTTNDIIATIPSKHNIPFVEALKNKENSKLFEVTKQNRDSIGSAIISYIKDEKR